MYPSVILEMMTNAVLDSALKNEDDYVVVSCNPLAFYICFACEIYALKQQQYYVHELLEQIEYVLINCLPSKPEFSYNNFNFLKEHQEELYQSLLSEVKGQADIVGYIKSRKNNVPINIDKVILCILHNLTLQENFGNGKTSIYNPLKKKYDLKDNVSLGFHANCLKVNRSVCKPEILRYATLLEMLCYSTVAGPGRNLDSITAIRQFVNAVFIEFSRILNSLDKRVAKLLVEFLFVSDSERTKEQTSMVSNYLYELKNKIYKIHISRLYEEIKDIIERKVLSFPFKYLFKKKIFYIIDSTGAVEQFDFLQYKVVNKFDVLFLKYKNSYYTRDSIYSVVCGYSYIVNSYNIGVALNLKNMLIHNFKVILVDGKDEDLLLDCYSEKIDWNNTASFKEYIRNGVNASSKSYNMSVSEYVNSMVYYGPLDEIAKILMSVIIGMVINECDTIGVCYAYRSPIEFEYSTNFITILQDNNFQNNCSYYTPAALKSLYLNKFMVANEPENKLENDKHLFVKMFTNALNYKPYGKCLIHCPLSNYGYLLPIMLICLKNKYLSVRCQSLDNIDTLRTAIIYFFIVNSEEYKLDLEDLSVRIGKHSNLDIESYLCNEFNNFPEELLQATADFLGLPLVKHDIYQPKPQEYKPEMLLSYQMVLEPHKIANKAIHLQYMEGNYNLLTDEQNWSIDETMLGEYNPKLQM